MIEVQAESSTCTDASRRRLLVGYTMRTISEGEEREFEDHLLACDACFSDVAAVWRVLELVQDRTARLDDGEAILPPSLRTRLRRRQALLFVWVGGALVLGFVLGAALV